MRLSSLAFVWALPGCHSGPAPTEALESGAAPESASVSGAALASRAPASGSVSDPARRLVAETMSLPVRGVVGYWGITPPADCAAASATEDAIRFLCTTGLDDLGSYFRYYYPVLVVQARPGGLTLGGADEQATGHAAALPQGEFPVQLIVNRPVRGGRDEVAESVRQRLLKQP